MFTHYWENLPLFKRLYHKLQEPVCEQFSLTQMELSILLFLNDHPACDTARDIVEVRHLTKSHVSASVKNLEACGYLRREFLDGNRKTVHLRLTPKADAVIEGGRCAQEKFFAVLRRGFTPAECAAMKRAFEKLAKNAGEALEEP